MTIKDRRKWIEGLVLRQDKANHVHVRALTPEDVAPLIELDKKKWGVDSFTPEALTALIKNTPGYCWGCFDGAGLATASLFFMALPEKTILEASTHNTLTDYSFGKKHDPLQKTLFAVSFASTCPSSAAKLIAEALACVLLKGIRQLYHVSILPRYAKWKRQHPEGTVEEYVNNTILGIFPDPLLSYYLGMGFKVVRIIPHWHPDASSMDYGILLKYRNRLWFLSPLLRLIGVKIFYKKMRYLTRH